MNQSTHISALVQNIQSFTKLLDDTSSNDYNEARVQALKLARKLVATLAMFEYFPQMIAILTSGAIQTNSGTPFFTAAAPYNSFFLLDFYFGCNLPTQEGVADVTTQCSILIAGFRKSDGKEVASASFTFTPPQGLTAQMIQAVLPDSFAGVYNVTVVQASPGTQSLYVDNLHYKVSKWAERKEERYGERKVGEGEKRAIW
ncbi:MAG: hypothetical protein Q9195_006708 [Heterodermia aff. obscurata]